MSTKSKKADVDSALTYLFLKKLMQPIMATPAFKAGIIDQTGKILREPDEKGAELFTLMDRMVIQLKRLLGPRIQSLYNFLYLQTLNNNLYNNVLVMSSPMQRAEVKRVSKTMKTMMESQNMEVDDLIYCLLTEDLLNTKEEHKLLEE